MKKLKSLFGKFPFKFKCVVCGKLKSIYSSVGFIKEEYNIRRRKRMCSQKCLRIKARELDTHTGMNDWNTYY